MTLLRLVLLAAVLAGCTVATGPDPRTVPVERVPGQGQSTDTFGTVVRRVEPVAEDLCRQQTSGMNCDYRIVLDDRPGVPSNAFQTLDAQGRPIIVFTGALLRDVRNADEIAFILGHEAAHHIEGHIPRTQQNTVTGAVLAGVIAAAAGADQATIQQAQEMGAFAGQRQFSKNFELEADALGTVIAYSAGYDPVTGAAFFTRIPDPGNRFLGTHPPNADRMRIVRETAAQLR